jgi:hypothetical protein
LRIVRKFTGCLPSINVGVIAALATMGIVASDSARAQQVPTVNIAATCRAASIVTVSLLGSTGANDFQVCMDGENRAREQIIKDWSAYALPTGWAAYSPVCICRAISNGSPAWK